MLKEHRRIFPYALWAWAGLCVAGWNVAAATGYYVTPAGAGDHGGTNWDNAYSNVQAAATLATNAGDTIYLQSGVYSNSSQIVISNAADVLIIGGCYGGAGANSNIYSGTNSTLTLVAGVTNRILFGYVSTARVEGVSFSGGIVADINGAGVYLTNCAWTMDNCVIASSEAIPATNTVCGAGMFMAMGTLTMSNCVVASNVIYLTRNYCSGYGSGLYLDRVEVDLRNTRFESNRVHWISQEVQTAAGGAIYSTGASRTILSNVVFSGNYAMAVWASQFGGGAYGGAIFLRGGDAVLDACTFTENYSRGQSASFGGAVNAGAMNDLRISDCTFRGCYAQSPGSAARGAALYLAGVTNASLSDCSIRDVPLIGESDGIRIDSPTTRLCMRHCTVEHSTLDGIGMSAGNLRMTNCLVAQSAGSGIYLMGGTASVYNVTLADNAGWGLNRTGGLASVSNSIAWGNTLGGIAGNTNVSAGYTCCQNELAGESNLVTDPLFIYSYYLSVAGLPGQAASSPCIACGNVASAALGLTNRTTRTDGLGDTNALVDLGYHYTNGVSDSALSNAVLYVDAAGGDDANDGLTALTALKTLGAGLARIMTRGEIRLAAGNYDAANGETFPLTVVQPHLSILGTNQELTVIDAGGANRVFYAVNKGDIRLEGMAIQGGALSNDCGAGLYAVGCGLALSNCAVLNNQLYPASLACYGSGMYLRLGKLLIDSCIFSNNFVNLVSGSSGYGGGMFIDRSPLTIRRTRFENNRINRVSGESHAAVGGAIYSSGANVEIANGEFFGNYAVAAPGGMWGGSAYGGALYLTQGNALLCDCAFSNNYASSQNTTRGGSIYVSAITTFTMRACTFSQGYVKSFNSIGCGGALYLAASNTDIMGCRIQDVGALGGYVGDTYIASGPVRMTNTLIAGNNGNGITIIGPASLINCTLATNTGWGITNAGVLSVKNSIIWDNSLGGIATNATTAISYSDVQDVTPPGTGNMNANPLFVDAENGDFHVMSLAGSWHGGIWINDPQMSPCIDAGEPAPASAYTMEPKPNAGRVNMGAYGNTAEASRSSRGTVFAVW